MSPYTSIEATEGLARSRCGASKGGGSAVATIAGHEVTVTVTSAMVNRGYATSDVSRYGYKLDGRRISRSMLLKRLCA